MKNWLHFILHEDGRSLYEDANGGVSSSASPKQLTHTPDGWKDISIGYQRDMKKFGMIKSFTFPLNFVRDGAKILRSIMYNAGYEFKLFYLITQRRIEMFQTEFKDYHSKWYRGEIDFSTFNDQENKVSCTIGPLGLEKLVKANEDTVYEIPLSDPDAKIIELDGMNLFSEVNYQAPPEVEFSDVLFTYNHVIPFGVLSKEGLSTGVAVFDQYLSSITGNLQTFFNTSSNFFLAVDVSSKPVTLTLSGKFVVKITQKNIAANIRFRIRSNKGLSIDIPGIATQLNVEFTIPINISFIGNPGENFFIEGVEHGTFQSGSTGFKYVFMPGSEVSLTYKNIYRKTYIRGFAPAVLLDKILEKISGKKQQSESTLLSTNPYRNIYLTSGDGIRGISDGVVKISLKKFYDIYGILAFGGQSIEGEKLRIESINDYFDNSVPPIDLGAATGLKVTVATNIMGNTIEIGHINKDIEDLNGKLRYNNLHQYTTPGTKIVNKLPFVSQAIADPYAIEHTRMKVGKKTTDSDKDNELFILHGVDAVATDLIGIAEKPKEAIIQNNSLVSFTEFNNIGLVPDSSVSVFTWFGQTVQTTIRVSITPVSSPTAGQNVRADIYVNSAIAIQQTVVANGSNSININQPLILNYGDNISIRLVNLSGGNIAVPTALLSVSFALLPIAKLFRETYQELVGVKDATVYNIALLTPKRLLLLWKKYLNSIFYKLDGKDFVFETTDRNPELLTKLNNIVTDEDADEPITKDILFKPYIFEFETEVPINLVETLEANQNAPFKFTWLGNEYKGFLMKGGIAPDDNRKQVFTLLCSPDTDETKLIQ